MSLLNKSKDTWTHLTSAHAARQSEKSKVWFLPSQEQLLIKGLLLNSVGCCPAVSVPLSVPLEDILVPIILCLHVPPGTPPSSTHFISPDSKHFFTILSFFKITAKTMPAESGEGLGHL